jgi:plastocyanin
LAKRNWDMLMGTLPRTTLAVMLLATACAGTSQGSGGSGAPQQSNVSMTDANQYVPASLSVPRGATVVWTNTGSVAHTVTDDPNKAINKADSVLPNGAQPFDSGIINGGGTYSHTFNVPGQYVYFCIPHESLGMVGRITVS